MGILGLITAQALAQLLMRTHLDMQDPQYIDPAVGLYLETESPPLPSQLMIGRELIVAEQEGSADDPPRAGRLNTSVEYTIESVHTGLTEPPEFKVLVSL